MTQEYITSLFIKSRFNVLPFIVPWESFMKRTRSVLSRRTFCQQVSLVASALAMGSSPLRAATEGVAAKKPWDPEDMKFLREIAVATVKAAHVAPGASRSGGGVNTTGIPLITPGGDYSAFWIRDYAMSLDCGLIRAEEMLPQLELIARCQSGSQRRTFSTGGILPPYSIPDHIRLDGPPIYYPGTMTADEKQGGGIWGPLPPTDDHFYFVHVAHVYWGETKDAAFLGKGVQGLTLLDRLIKAFHSPASDPKTGAVVTDPGRAVGFGFQDTVYLLGAMAFATLLRWQAARQLADLCKAAGNRGAASQFEQIAATIAANLVPTFCDPAKVGGWLLAATKYCRQPDVWATLYALHLGILPRDAQQRARETVVEALRTGQEKHVIEFQGGVRHVPTTFDYSEKSAWEGKDCGKGGYQNGAYLAHPDRMADRGRLSSRRHLGQAGLRPLHRTPAQIRLPQTHRRSAVGEHY